MKQVETAEIEKEMERKKEKNENDGGDEMEM